MSGRTPGVAQDFVPGDHPRVEAVLQSLASLGVPSLRTRVTSAQWETPEGQAWITWLLERTAKDLEVVPCLVGSAKPEVAGRTFASFVDQLCERLGACFTWVELWDDTRELRQWDWRADADASRFARVISEAASAAKRHGKKVALGGTSPFDPAWLERMARLEDVDAFVLRAMPGTHDTVWSGWDPQVAMARQSLASAAPGKALWLHAGFAARDHDERRQLVEFLDAASTDADRLFWRSAGDVPEVEAEPFGLFREDGSPRLLGRLWQEHGLEALPALRALTEPSPQEPRNAMAVMRAGSAKEGHTVIFGGSGFIGSNVANALCEGGRRVLVFDNLSRTNVERNLRWLKDRHGALLEVRVGDIRDARAVREAVAGAAEIFHFAAQVAVTTSLVDPVHDFEVNARGTLNVLEAARAQAQPPPILFTSTNKVYGGLEDVMLRLRAERYEPDSETLRAHGIPEVRGIEFETPYGCSKGTADQYVLDYARSFGLKVLVFRMSCIYGPRQFGNEDQGWVAHFLIRALQGQPITLYGDGRQVRDILYVDDLVRAMRMGMAQIDQVGGRAYNIGGGPARTVSLRELLARIEGLTGYRARTSFEDWRVGDQRYYVSDIRRFEHATGWTPQVDVAEGVARLHGWLEELLGRTRRTAPSMDASSSEIHAL